jgi:hypothetical protein
MLGPHSHAHRHPDGGGRHDHPEPVAPPLSLLRMSLVQRLAWAAAAVAVIWIGVFWAMRPS